IGFPKPERNSLRDPNGRSVYGTSALRVNSHRLQGTTGWSPSAHAGVGRGRGIGRGRGVTLGVAVGVGVVVGVAVAVGVGVGVGVGAVRPVSKTIVPMNSL